MSLEVIRLLLDFGLVILIWIVQRIVYPSFLYYRKENLLTWHNEYTARFATIVMPIMLGQLGVATYQLILDLNLYTVASCVIIGLVWLSTFLQFVPIHSNIARAAIDEKTLKSLVTKNWIRTVLWTLLFVLSCIQVY